MFLKLLSSSADPRMRATFATARATMVIGIHQRLRRLAAGFSVSWLVFAFMVLIDRPFIQVNAYTVVKSSFKRSRDSARWLGMWPRHRSERFFWAPGSAGARAGACGAQNVKTVHPPDRRAMS